MSSGTSLTPRLRAIADFVLPGRPMADVGTDHAQLPVDLVTRGAVPRAIACDVRAGPLEAARKTVAAAGCADRVELRQGDGLAAVGPNEVETVVIAGMGGRSIAAIVDAARPGTGIAGVRRLVLAPNGGVGRLRRRLAELGWRIVDETVVDDAGHLYPIVVAEPASTPVRLDETDLAVGPILRHRTDAPVRAWAAQELARTRRALDGLARAREVDTAKRERLEALAALLARHARPED